MGLENTTSAFVHSFNKGKLTICLVGTIRSSVVRTEQNGQCGDSSDIPSPVYLRWLCIAFDASAYTSAELEPLVNV